MKFRTEIEIGKVGVTIEPDSKLLFMGSCFATNIGTECTNRGFSTLINPFGVTYNPRSLTEILRLLDRNEKVNENNFRYVNGSWCSMLNHSTFNSKSRDGLVTNVNRAVIEGHEYLKTATHLFITLGTAWVYYDKELECVVNNCHKIPEAKFNRGRLTVEEIVENFSDYIDNRITNRGSKIIFTISPIRHLRDGLIGNSTSKAILRCAVDILCEKYSDIVSYFPSYEVMIDDLRDYRFYDADMVHPNGVATSYIYSIFEKYYLSSSTIEYTKKMERITRAMNHRVLDSNSDSYSLFIDKLQQDIINIKKRYPQGYYENVDKIGSIKDNSK